MINKKSLQIPDDSMIHKKYKIGRVLGYGGMGVVCSVRLKDDPSTEYALKYRYNDFNELSKKRFLDEIKLLKKIKSENFPKLFDSYSDAKEQFYVMELVKGETLYDMLKKNRQLPVNTANNFIRQIANAIGELHSLGIIHRDIKSQNIMIQENYYIKVLDLGISVSEESHRYTRTNAIICSPHYSAPEYTIKNAKITKAVDIYAIGIVYYEMLIGKYPFESDKENKTILMHRDKEFPNPKNYRDLPQSVCNIIIRATAKNPKERYPDVWELRNDVYTSLRDDRKLEKPISIKTLKAKRSLSEIINSTKFLIISIIVILLIIGGIVLAAWFLGVVDVRI